MRTSKIITKQNYKNKLRVLISHSKHEVSKAVSAIESARGAGELSAPDRKAAGVLKRALHSTHKKGSVCYLFDSGSDAHITNDKSVFDSALRSCMGLVMMRVCML